MTDAKAALVLQVYEQLFTDATPERINDLFDQLDGSHTGYIDYLEWSKKVDLKDVPKMVKNCRTKGPLFQSSLTEDEFRQLRRMMRRLHDLADAASKVTTGPLQHFCKDHSCVHSLVSRFLF